MADGVHRRGPRDELLLEVRGPVRIVTLNRPEALNAANEALHGEIARVWRELDADPETRAIVLTGAGSAFSAGGDLNLLQRMVEDAALRESKALLNQALRASVESWLAGAIAAESASFDEPAFQGNLTRMLGRAPG